MTTRSTWVCNSRFPLAEIMMVLKSAPAEVAVATSPDRRLASSPAGGAAPGSASWRPAGPASQGTAAAQDAVTQAAALGFGPGTPIYYDMEAYPAAQEKNALAFMSAWTTELHAEGYKSGIYSSSSSGVTDLVANFTRDAMPDVIWDALWNGQANTTDPAIPATDWADNDRAHQFNGGNDETYGRDTMDVDQDYLDLSLTPSAETIINGRGTGEGVRQ